MNEQNQNRDQERHDYADEERLSHAQGRFNQTDDDLPEVNRQKKTSRLTTILGFVLIIGLALFAIWRVNAPKGEPKVKADQNKVENRLPSFTVPELVEPPPPPPTKLASAPEVSDEDKVDPAFLRKLKGSLVQTGGSNSGTGTNQGSDRDRHMAGYSQRVGPGIAGGVNYTQPGEQGAIAAGEEGAMGGGTVGGSGGGMGGTVGGSGGSMGGSGNQTLVANGDGPSMNGHGGLNAVLKSTKTELAAASILPNRNFVLAKGTALDCVLETAISSDVPSMATCRLTRDIYSDNGKVVLLDGGSQLVGEFQGRLRQGQARMFMLWTRVKTPKGVIVSLDSPGADELGRGGITGNIDNHFWTRFGAAIMTSLLSDSIKIVLDNETQKSGTAGSVNFRNTANSGEAIVSSILGQQANIPPTLLVNQGTRLNVILARDLDFSTVYKLKSVQ